MNDQFEKLDQFMKKNVPHLMVNIPLAKKPSRIGGKLLAPILALGMASVITLTIMKTQMISKDESTLALSEALEWDFTVDDFPQEIEEVIAFAE